MQITKKDLPQSQIELSVILSVDEFNPYIKKATIKISQEIKIDGFRPGKAPFNILKSKIGDMTIVEEASRLAINGTMDKIIADNIDGTPVGSPQINITKLAPDNPLEYKIILVLLPKIELGEYKNLKIQKEVLEVEEKEIEKMIEKLREMRVVESIAEKSIENGDKIIVNIEMFLDKVPIEGGQSKETNLIIGKDYIIPGFDKQLIGLKKLDVKEFKLPYPTEHHMKNLAGKMVDFKVTVKEVYERKLPEFNDEFARTLGLNNVLILKENIRKSIQAEKEQKVKQELEIKIIDKIIEKTKFSDIPEMLVNNEVTSLISELEYNVQSQGGKFEDYLSSMKKTRDQLTLDWLPQALKRVKGSLLIREIAIREKIEANDVEIAKKQEDLLKQYKGQKNIEDKIDTSEYKAYLKNVITNEKIMKKLMEWNVAKHNA